MRESNNIYSPEFTLPVDEGANTEGFNHSVDTVAELPREEGDFLRGVHDKDNQYETRAVQANKVAEFAVKTVEASDVHAQPRMGGRVEQGNESNLQGLVTPDFDTLYNGKDDFRKSA